MKAPNLAQSPIVWGPNLLSMPEMLPHRGLPPCRGGGAYTPMTRTIFKLKERS